MMKDKKTIEETVRFGMASDFWEIIVDSLKDKILELAQEQSDQAYRQLPAIEYKVQSELLFSKIDFLKELQKLPETIIIELQDSAVEKDNHDPFRTAEDFVE
jgi:hypothetical protein